MLSRSLALVTLLLLGGCNLHTYDYRVTPALPGPAGKSEISVIGVDARQYLRDRRIKPSYLGMVRDVMFAAPYLVHSVSRQPLADDLAVSVAQGLTKAGYRATALPNANPGSLSDALAAARAAGKPRTLLVRINEFESDSMIRTEFFYDLEFEIYDKSGRLLGSNRVRGQEMFPGSFVAYSEARRKLPPRVSKLLTEGISPLLKHL